jgi:hypothetical protein
LSKPRTTVDRTDTEAWESERNRVAWNLPLGVKPAPSKPIREMEREPEREALSGAADKVAERG